MGRSERKAIIEKIEAKRNSKVLVYFVGDRPLVRAIIASDSIRWLFEHLQSMDDNKQVKTIDFYLYSLGGSLDTPWPIITILREYCKNLNVLITFKAFSATTLTSLGADKIVMGRKGELGPIDPQMQQEQKGKGPPGTSPSLRPMSTEDISSYISFIKDKVGITDQNALAALTKSLTDTVSPPTLGQVNRVHSHIRAVARKMLSLVKPAFTTTRIQEIVESLTEKTFIHGHSIGRSEAKQLGLQIEDMDDELEKLCWELFLQYEKDLKLHSYTSPLAYFDSDDQDEYEEDDATLACIESVKKCHEFCGPLKLKKVRQLPTNLNLKVDVPLQLPAGVAAAQIPAQIQQLLQQVQQNLAAGVANMVVTQLRNQMPIKFVEVQMDKMIWKEIT